MKGRSILVRAAVCVVAISMPNFVDAAYFHLSLHAELQHVAVFHAETHLLCVTVLPHHAILYVRVSRQTVRSKSQPNQRCKLG
jgi:hypothetical protein